MLTGYGTRYRPGVSLGIEAPFDLEYPKVSALSLTSVSARVNVCVKGEEVVEDILHSSRAVFSGTKF